MTNTTIRKHMTMTEINDLDYELYELYGSRENIIAFFGIEVHYCAEVAAAANALETEAVRDVAIMDSYAEIYEAHDAQLETAYEKLAAEELKRDTYYAEQAERTYEERCQAFDEIERLFDEPESEYDAEWFENHGFEWDAETQQWYNPEYAIPYKPTEDEDDDWDADMIDAQCTGNAENTALDIATIEEFTMDYSFGADDRLFEAALNDEFAKYNY